MSKKKVLGLSSEDLPEEIAKALENFIKDQIEDEEETKLVPLLTITQKDLMKYARIQGRRDMIATLADMFQKVVKGIDKDVDSWWRYIEDKYDIGHDKSLNINPDTGLLSERVKEDKGLKLAKKGPLN